MTDSQQKEAAYHRHHAKNYGLIFGMQASVLLCSVGNLWPPGSGLIQLIVVLMLGIMLVITAFFALEAYVQSRRSAPPPDKAPPASPV